MFTYRGTENMGVLSGLGPAHQYYWWAHATSLTAHQSKMFPFHTTASYNAAPEARGLAMNQSRFNLQADHRGDADHSNAQDGHGSPRSQVLCGSNGRLV